jgi:hypothetical protein
MLRSSIIPASIQLERKRVRMPKLDEQISTLQERLKQLKLRQQRSEARQRAVDAQRERKAETRRRFVVGTVILEKVGSGEIDRSQLLVWLDSSLTRKEDRALFDLPPKA